MKPLLTVFFICLFSLNINAQNEKCNCCTETHAAFDFWIGTWDVTNPDGTKAGTNTLVKIQDKCVLQENWTSASPGYTGTSNSFYNATTKQWEQVWIDNKGGNLHLKGNMKNDYQMVLQTDQANNKEGNSFIHRVTWTNMKTGDVRQLWETITQTSEGEKITVAFDGLYKKR